MQEMRLKKKAVYIVKLNVALKQISEYCSIITLLRTLNKTLR
jgi:hypothetical protein